MPYSTTTDIKLRFPEAVLAQVSQDEPGDDSINLVRANIAIGDADAEIDFYLSGKYVVPFSEPIPPMIKIISIHLAVHGLYKAKYDDKMPEEIARYRTESIEMLTLIKTGELTLPGVELSHHGGSGTTGDSESAEFAVLCNIDEEDIVYSQELLNRI